MDAQGSRAPRKEARERYEMLRQALRAEGAKFRFRWRALESALREQRTLHAEIQELQDQVERAKRLKPKPDARIEVPVLEERLRQIEGRHGRSTREMLESAAAAEQGIRKALQAAAEIVESSLSLVALTAPEYVRPGWTVVELVQAGMTGLMAAVERFQVRTGRRFSPFAERKIRRAITQAMAKRPGSTRHGAR